jgi:GDP-L-fucose synthase
MIIVTGGTGLLGNAFKKILPDAVFPTSKELDLTNKKNTIDFFDKHGAAVGTVIHLAGKVGGVKANTQYVSDFYEVNSAINNNVISSCVKNNVPMLVCCLSTCIYPDEKYVKYPLTEDQLHNGPPHDSNFGYAYAKRMVDVQLKAVRQQYGYDYTAVVPNNMYGEHDNFDLENGHVIPALIRKIWEAKINNKPSFTVWGDGEIYREFTYAEDIAKAILFCIDNYIDVEPINIGSTQEHRLKDVIQIITKHLDYKGDIIFDITKPKGQVRKPSSNQKLLDLGWKKEWYTPLDVGLKKTCDWFKQNYPNVRGI